MNHNCLFRLNVISLGIAVAYLLNDANPTLAAIFTVTNDTNTGSGANNILNSGNLTVADSIFSNKGGINSLQTNGSPTQTEAFLPKSLAIDTANPNSFLINSRGPLHFQSSYESGIQPVSKPANTFAPIALGTLLAVYLSALLAVYIFGCKLKKRALERTSEKYKIKYD